MPRPKKAGGPEPKKRSRNGCWPCKARKVKCDELHPSCLNCQRQGEACDYSIRLNWDGRGSKKKDKDTNTGQITFGSTPILSPSSSSSASTPQESLLRHPSSVVQTGPPRPTQLADIPHQNTLKGARYDAHRLSNPLIDPLLRNGEPQERLPYARPELSNAFSHERHRGSLPDQSRPNLQRLRATSSDAGSLPSLSEASLGSPGYFTFSNGSPANQSLPFSAPTFMTGSESGDGSLVFGSSDRPPKRPRYDSIVRSPRSRHMLPPSATSSSSSGVPPSGSGIASWTSTVVTAAAPTSNYSNDSIRPQHPKVSLFSSYDAAESARRKPSIESLLSGPAGMGSDYTSRGSISTTRGSVSDYRGSFSNPRSSISDYRGSFSDPPRSSFSDPPRSSFSDPRPSIGDLKMSDVPMADEMVIYGIDRGIKDLDVPDNDDANAITGASPVARRAHLDHEISIADFPFGFGFGVKARNEDFGDDYYAKPVPVTVPRRFEPLPASLSNPMNLLYFHHFMSHTARILVPHHCASNPLQKLLPLMALRDRNLMSLLLAYSASHRARLLQQPIPTRRIAAWVQDVIPNLRYALNDPAKMVNNTSLATAIMLASLEIICPNAFGSQIGWRQHLNVARQMIAVRGGSRHMHQDHSEVTHFLLRWFAYLDVIGSLTGVDNSQQSAKSWTLEYDIDVHDHDCFQIDCLLGFTSRCCTILARISDLARSCELRRITPHHTVRGDYEPSPEVIAQAHQLITDIEVSLANSTDPHRPDSPAWSKHSSDSHSEMAAVNSAYHFAGLVHLHRRVLGKPTNHPDVQQAVREILGCIARVRRGATAEACLLSPMFAAGCDAGDDAQRNYILSRIRAVEECGMSQVTKTRRLMQKVWETGRPWETLVAGEFVG